jgi:hypothetical protein
MLVTRHSAVVQPLRTLIEQQKHRTLVLWALDCAPRVLAIFEERVPNDPRPRQALEATEAWARGEIKMPVAKKAAHATHNAASEVTDDPVNGPAATAAARAMGHVVGTVHVETHAIGLVSYGITAFVYASGYAPNSKEAAELITRECDWFYERLLYWQENIEKIDEEGRPWAAFLLRDNLPNKEKLLHHKEEEKAKAQPSSLPQ